MSGFAVSTHSQELPMTTTPATAPQVNPRGAALARVTQEVVGIHEGMTPDQVLAIYDRILFYERSLKELRAMTERAMVEWMRTNGDITLASGVRFTIGHIKTTKCVNAGDAFEAVMQAAGGDWEKAKQVLASNAIKPGAAKKVLSPEEYERHFKTTVKDTLEGGEPAPKELLVIDQQWVK
jgi:hypothetical protein